MLVNTQANKRMLQEMPHENMEDLSAICYVDFPKQGVATIELGFVVRGREELSRIVEKLRQIEGVIDIERTAG